MREACPATDAGILSTCTQLLDMQPDLPLQKPEIWSRIEHTPGSDLHNFNIYFNSLLQVFHAERLYSNFKSSTTVSF
jgi:hypothetical protein